MKQETLEEVANKANGYNVYAKETKQEELDCPFEFTSRCTMGRCDCKRKQETLEEPKQEFNIIDEWLENNGTSEIKKQVKQEAKELCGETLEEGFDRIYESMDFSEFDFASFKLGAKWQQEQIGKSEFLQRLRATKSNAEARRLILEKFKK
jgi:hypothetical protein